MAGYITFRVSLARALPVIIWVNNQSGLKLLCCQFKDFVRVFSLLIHSLKRQREALQKCDILGGTLREGEST